ncbi:MULTISPECIES: PleD family two-component system response regulator [unclassified Clostridioides]|uniref:response regulator n=1 Tax=unclassified Clostridioides TaxID=2635829 RepID=UPI001D12AC8E|nr:response regulator [Clostridioides sp. ES-S-0171-01]MCC0688860.1 response regulator [Clostridioides sp. ES-S-0056-01]UDN53517.1 response regulator [Clostridioides sp. ES-S-0054-01]
MNAEHRVLIIDSDLKNCKAIKYALTEYGISAYYTLSVIDGIERLNRHNYELVILDISLSETDGFQLLRFMRQMRNMPILVLSSLGDIENKGIPIGGG